jgi:hypothetical protein
MNTIEKSQKGSEEEKNNCSQTFQNYSTKEAGQLNCLTIQRKVIIHDEISSR